MAASGEIQRPPTGRIAWPPSNESTPISVTGCAKKKALTRAQKLKAALKACHKKKGSSRKKCETAAKKGLGPLKQKR